MLANIPRLVSAYYTARPDPSVPAERVSFGTSGHRGSSLDRSFTESHILAISQAICQHRAEAGIDGPLFLGIDTHALSESAWGSALEVFGAQRRRRDAGPRRRLHPDAGGLPCRADLEPGPVHRARRRRRDHAVA